MMKWNLKGLHLVVMLCVCLFWNASQAEDKTDHSRLQSFISDYKDGDYQKTADSIAAILPSLKDPEDVKDAYKYLGFSFGMLNWIDKSKAIFKTVLKKFPGMEIDTLEVPPNIAIIFRQAKLERKLESIDSTGAGTVHVIVRKKNVAVPVVLLSTAIIGAALGADLLYYGDQQHQKYLSVKTPDQSVIDRYFSQYRNATIGGAACIVVTAVLLPVSLYHFVKKDPFEASREKGASVSFVNGLPALVICF
jgi:hypothetical protein